MELRDEVNHIMSTAEPEEEEAVRAWSRIRFPSPIPKLYEREINGSVSWFFDSGYHVRIGDDMNGYTESETLESWEEVEEWFELAATRVKEGDNRYPSRQNLVNYADEINKECISMADFLEKNGLFEKYLAENYVNGLLKVAQVQASTSKPAKGG